MTDLSKLSIPELRELVVDDWDEWPLSDWPLDVQAFDELAERYRRLEEAHGKAIKQAGENLP